MQLKSLLSVRNTKNERLFILLALLIFSSSLVKSFFQCVVLEKIKKSLFQ